MAALPQTRKFETGLEAHYYTAPATFHDEDLTRAVGAFCALPDVLSPIVLLPDVSHKAERISPTGMTLATRDAIVPAALPAANGSGVRLAALDVQVDDCSDEVLEAFLREIAARVPIYGQDSPDLLRSKLRDEDLLEIYRGGAPWLADRLGIGEDFERIESNGCFSFESDSLEEIRAAVPEFLFEQGLYNLGILETGNHFIELQIVEDLIDHNAANLLGIEPGQILLMIHDGSPASLVSQYFQPTRYAKASHAESFERDKILFHDLLERDAKARANSQRFFAPSTPYFSISQNEQAHRHFLSLMAMACNFGLANRLMLQDKAQQALTSALRRESIHCRTLTDTLHDCVKTTRIGQQSFMVHRHGASEARPASDFASGHPFAQTGQLVGIPGAPGRPSILAAAGETQRTWHTLNHGAGRQLDRSIARQRFSESDSLDAVCASGAHLERRGLGSFAGENPAAYKDVDEVMAIAESAGLAGRIARLRPAAIYKG